MLYSQENLVHYAPEARAGIITFVKEAAADFRASGGRFQAPTLMRSFASFNAATKLIKLSRSEIAEAKLAALVEELIHFRQAQAAGVFGEPGGWFSRYSPEQWRVLSLELERCGRQNAHNGILLNGRLLWRKDSTGPTGPNSTQIAP